MDISAQQAHWLKTGLKFGYPVCCVLAFINMEHKHDKTPRQLEGTGYVPCSQCNTEFGLMQLVANINETRDPSLMPFPNEELK
jgi:hypothetical protein